MKYETVIVGAGIAGLACAKQLYNNGKNFLLISKDIGGRILTSEDDKINYGAFFVCSDYEHVLKHVSIQSRIRLRDFCFHENNEYYTLFEPKLLRYTSQFLKIIKILHRFRKRLRNLRRNSMMTSQKQAIEDDLLLYKLYMQNANDLIRTLHLQSGTNAYLSKALYSTTFSTIHQMNAFSFLQYLTPLITPIYTFTFERERMIQPFQEDIIIGEVTNIQYKNDYYKVTYDNKGIKAKNIVFATEIDWSKKFAHIKQTNKSIDTHMIHVKGKLRNHMNKRKYHLFHPNNNIQAIAVLTNSSYLLYYKKDPPTLKKIFVNPQIIAEKYWNAAGTINGHNLIETKRPNNMYLIGDHNIAGLEDAYITGLYSANQIIKNSL